jgi:hypothetical protein
MTDDFTSYNILDKNKKYIHFTVAHSAGQYSAGGGIHTNGIEGHWSILKRMYYGTYHHFSEKYMQRYVDEASFRNNHREDDLGFENLLKQGILPVRA